MMIAIFENFNAYKVDLHNYNNNNNNNNALFVLNYNSTINYKLII